MPLSVKRPEQQKHAEHKSEIANAIDDECFIAGAGVGVIGVPKTDQRVRT